MWKPTRRRQRPPRLRLHRAPVPRLASSCRGSAPAAKVTKLRDFASARAASDGGLLLFVQIDPQVDGGIEAIVELADGFGIALLAVFFGIDLVVGIQAELREAIRAVLLGKEAFYRQGLHVLQVNDGAGYRLISFVGYDAGKHFGSGFDLFGCGLTRRSTQRKCQLRTRATDEDRRNRKRNKQHLHQNSYGKLTSWLVAIQLDGFRRPCVHYCRS